MIAETTTFTTVSLPSIGDEPATLTDPGFVNLSSVALAQPSSPLWIYEKSSGNVAIVDARGTLITVRGNATRRIAIIPTSGSLGPVTLNCQVFKSGRSGIRFRRAANLPRHYFCVRPKTAPSGSGIRQ